LEYYQFFVDAWRMFKKYKAIAVNTEEYFDAVFETAQKLENRYRNHRFAVDIVRVIVEELRQIAENGG